MGDRRGNSGPRARRLGLDVIQIAQHYLEYVAKHRDEDIVARLNEVYSELPSGVDPALRRAQARSLSAEW